MSPASWSLIAFLAAVGLSCTSRINVGLIALALAWGAGIRVYAVLFLCGLAGRLGWIELPGHPLHEIGDIP